jgi:hypothetical protein
MSLPISIIKSIYDTPDVTYVHSLWRDLPKKGSYSAFEKGTRLCKTEISCCGCYSFFK